MIVVVRNLICRSKLRDGSSETPRFLTTGAGLTSRPSILTEKLDDFDSKGLGPTSKTSVLSVFSMTKLLCIQSFKSEIQSISVLGGESEDVCVLRYN